MSVSGRVVVVGVKGGIVGVWLWQCVRLARTKRTSSEVPGSWLGWRKNRLSNVAGLA